MRRKRVAATAGFTALSALMLLRPIQAYAECYCNATEPFDVIVQNWQTFKPKVTAMHSFNAYLANQLGQKVYYVPTLDRLPNVRNRMYNCTDFRGTNQKFAAIYDGFFDVECQDVLMRNQSGGYTQVPTMMQDTASGSERELTTLGYDFLLRNEWLENIQSYDTMVSAEYKVEQLDIVNGSIDVRTAVMDIYKAIGQEVLETTYIFANDPTLSLETSPIQSEIHLQMAKDDSIDVSTGAGYVFTTRSNPDLYWDKAIRDHVVASGHTLATDAAKGDKGFNTATSKALTLSEFCAYAYEIMNIYGEPTMTTAEKSILLQLYGTDIPYKSVDDFAVEAIENFIAKGIISPDDDRENLTWNAPITPKYMLTLLMRIADVDSRMTYKDVLITINPTLLDNNYYAADVSVERSAIVDIKEDNFYAKVSTYVDNAFSEQNVTSSLGASGEDKFYIQNHLVVLDTNGNYVPLNTLVVTEALEGDKADERHTADFVMKRDAAAGKYSAYNTAPFAECLGWQDDKLVINVFSMHVPELLHSDGKYHFHMQKRDGTYSSSALEIEPGKRSVDVPSRGTSGGSRDYDDDEDEDDDWDWDDDEDDDEDEDDDWEDMPDIDLAASDGAVVMLTIEAGKEGSIYFKGNSQAGVKKSLAEIMQQPNENGYGYLVPNDNSEIHAKKISDTVYQIEGVRGIRDLQDRTEEIGNSKASRMEGFVQKDEELVVSVNWLKAAGFISSCTSMGEQVICLKTAYNEIYLDRAKKIIVAGTTIYSLLNLEEDEIFYADDSAEYFVNFRAVMGWTGDYMMFKNSTDGIVTVSVKSYPVDGKNSLTGNAAGLQNVMMKQMTYDANAMSRFYTDTNMSQYIQGSINESRVLVKQDYGSKYTVSMTCSYPFANWFIFSKGILGSEDGTDQDWLFVFKPKKVRVNGKDITYDDSGSRQIMKSVLGDFKLSQEEITVWAYPMHPKHEDTWPVGFKWDDDYGWSYTPQKITSIKSFLSDYMDESQTYGNSNGDKPKNILPLVQCGNNLICVNFNSYSVNQNMGESILDYGTLPLASLRPIVPEDGKSAEYYEAVATGFTLAQSGASGAAAALASAAVESTISNLIVQLKGNQDQQNNAVSMILRKGYLEMDDSTGYLSVKYKADSDDVVYDNCKVYPTVVSPALWVMDIGTYTWEDIEKNVQSSRLFNGTDELELVHINGELCVYQGNTKLDIDEFKNKKYLRLRGTSGHSNNTEYLYSESQLNAFELNKSDGASLADKVMSELGVGLASSHIDVIDWDEFTLERILEDFEFGVAITMVVILYIIPRICLFVFLMLLALGCIQNVKVVQLFCDKIFDPYKFLTMGRRNVHTFRSGVAFRNSIIAMAVFALFMDGTIIHIFEWVVEWLAYILGGH